MTHMDIVPPGELAQWRGDPFKAWVEGGKIFGRGVEDNQQDLVASLFAVKAFQAENLKPSSNIGIALVADEETGSTKGIDYVLQHSQAFKKKDLIIVPDAGNKHGTLIEVAEKGILWLKFKTVGKQAHASTPDKGINSFKAASLPGHGARQPLQHLRGPGLAVRAADLDLRAHQKGGQRPQHQHHPRRRRLLPGQPRASPVHPGKSRGRDPTR